MISMMTIIDKCIKKYETCWAGDVRVALCLRDVKIFGTSNNHFHGSGFEYSIKNSSWEIKKADQKPITFHKMKPDQFILLENVRF